MPGLGQDFFPTVDAGQLKLHLRASTGTRIEDTAVLCDQVEKLIRETVRPGEITSIVDNLGLPYSGINLAYSTSAPVGPGDADIFINLAKKHHSLDDYQRELRKRLAASFPSTQFQFLPADIVSQILNFGLPSPLDVQVVGPNVEANRDVHEVPAAQAHRHRRVPWTCTFNSRTTTRRSMSTSTARKAAVSRPHPAERRIQHAHFAVGKLPDDPVLLDRPATPAPSTTWSRRRRNIALTSLNDLGNTPLSQTTGSVPAADGTSQILSNVATMHHSVAPAVVSHYNAQVAFDIYGNVQGTDLGFVAAQFNKVIDAARKDLPKGSTIHLKGQVETMQQSFRGLLLGLVGAIILVYMLIVVNFQSLLDPLIIITALPAALAGIVWMLFLTHTTVSVPALTGAIMCMGVATANSVLVISFAREQMTEGKSAREAALEAGFTRLRPVIMTATAMIIGMIPMALGLGESGEQNAPLGRAVIGGLIFATVATLFFVPTVFTLVHGRKPRGIEDPESVHG